MKTIRLLVYFCVGLLLGSTAVLSHAETIAATQQSGYCAGWSGVAGSQRCDTSCYGAIDASGRAVFGAGYRSGDGCPPNYIGNLWCWTDGNGTRRCNGSQWVAQVYTCPTTGGWTVTGSNCVRPDCEAGQTRDETTGQCISQCPMYPPAAGTPVDKPANCQCPSGTKWSPEGGCRKKCTGAYEDFTGKPAWGDPTLFYKDGASTGCYGGCEVQPQSDDYYRANGGRYFRNSTYTGWTCGGTGEGSKPTPDNQPEPNQPEKPAGEPHEPKCNGENVVTRSDGTVICMPAGTPNTHKPKTEEVKKSEQYSDGSSKETTTHTTTDPGTGAKYYITTTTVSPATGGGAGAAGTPGTSTSTTKGGTTGTGSGAGKDGGECDPTSQFCGGPSGELWQAKEKTFDQALNKFRAGVAGTPVGAATTGFFAVSVPNGSCPSWQVAVPVLDVTLNLSQYFCTAEAIQMMDLVGAVLLALVSFVAFRWAIL